ncbi:MAG: metallophosphoesterase family protein [Acidimicrobiales bacterium]
MSSFRFIHAADIHLDSPLKGLTRHEGAAAERIRSATRAAFDGLISEAIEQQVAFVVIAGDLYDGSWKDVHTGLFFSHQMGRLAQAGIRAFVLHGNHDAESQITRRLQLPDCVKVFSHRKAETFVLEDLKVALHGQSFPQPAVTENLVPGYPEPRAGYFNIGVLHTALGGMGEHENYAPCGLDELVAKGYPYWALGHVHQGQVLHEHPHVVFPGNLQGRHIRETGAKGAYLVTVEGGEVAGLATLHTDVVRWSRLSVPVEACRSVDEVLESIRGALQGVAATEADGRLLACRVDLTGRTSLHGALWGATEQLRAEAQAAALGLGEEVAWIEKVVIETTPVSVSGEADPENALGVLRGLLAEASRDPDLLAQLGAKLGEFARKLPADLRQDVEDPALKAALEGDYGAVVERTRDELLSRLEGA